VGCNPFTSLLNAPLFIMVLFFSFFLPRPFFSFWHGLYRPHKGSYTSIQLRRSALSSGVSLCLSFFFFEIFIACAHARVHHLHCALLLQLSRRCVE
jgi:hypothetical protein